MRILVTGAAGFVGGHLIRHLRHIHPESELHGTALSATEAVDGVILHALDLRNPQAVAALIAAVRPDQVYHLAAWAQVRQSFHYAWETIENNVRVQLNVILGILAAKIAPRMLIVTSGEIYGGDQSHEYPTREDAPLRPANPYSVSKVTQDMMGLQYFLSHELPILRARPFNHLGPGQAPGFVAPDFALQIARIEQGLQPPVMKVGSLTAERDFTDVRDIVRAYRLIMERGTPGEAYNVASGTTHRIGEVLDMLLRGSAAAIRVESRSALLEGENVPRSWGDASKLHKETGWEPVIPLETTLQDVLEDCRARVGAQS